MASGKDGFDIYVGQRLLWAAGAMLIAGDLTVRVREFFKKPKASGPPQLPQAS
jgi:hypothetical protein